MGGRRKGPQILLKFETALPVNAVTAALAACEQVASEQGDATQIALAPDLLLVLLLVELKSRGLRFSKLQ